MSVQYSGEKITFADGSTVASGWSGFKNRLINSDMRIDQRNAGNIAATIAAFFTSGTYTLDRWSSSNSQAAKYTVQQNAGNVTPPAGYKNYLGCTVASSGYTLGAGDYFLIGQSIEGFNCADLNWGSASAATVTLSFWVRSSVTGTFGGVIKTSSGSRGYPFSYTINSANTWEQKSITVAGDTSGTWPTDNTAGIQIVWSLGTGSTYSGTANSWSASNLVGTTGATSLVATANATWYITGVQLEKGSTATSFDYRPYGTELALCQRYFEIFTAAGGSSNYVNFLNGGANAATQARYVMQYSVTKRAFPSVSFTTASGFSAQKGDDSLTTCTALVAEHLGVSGCQVTATVASGFTVGANSRLITNNNTTATISISSEL